MVQYLQSLRGLVLPTMPCAALRRTPVLRCAERIPFFGWCARNMACRVGLPCIPLPPPSPLCNLAASHGRGPIQQPCLPAVARAPVRSFRRPRSLPLAVAVALPAPEIGPVHRTRCLVLKQQQHQAAAAAAGREHAADSLSCRVETERSPSPAGCMRAFAQHVPA